MKTTGYKESLEQYKDLVDKKGFADYLGDAFSKVGSGPAVGEAQRMSNAMLSGMGAGISGAAAEERKQKLSPMLEQAGRITAKAAELEAQMQESEQNRLLITNFIKQSAVPIAQLSQASLARDIPASNELAKGIYLNFKQGAGDPTMGDFDHYHNGVIYYHNLETGAIEGENVIGLMYQAGIDPKTIWGQDAPMIEAGLSPGAKKNYEDSEKMRQLEMQGKSADVALKQAHAGVYQQQANQIQNEIANPPMSDMDKFNYQETRKSNETFLKNLTEDVEKKDPDTKIKVLDKLENIIGSGAAGIGNTPLARMQRWTKENFGKDADIQEAKMLQKYFFPDIKGVAGNPNQKEWSDLVTRIISGEQNVDAALEMIKFEKEQANALKNKYNNYRKAIIDSGNRLPYYHPEITSRVEQTVSNPATSQTGSGNQNLPSDEELGIKFY